MSQDYLTNAFIRLRQRLRVITGRVIADSAETEKTGELLTYGLVQLKPMGITRRYLCYQARPTEYHGWMITIIYLEGSATLEDLRSMFEKQ